MQAHEDKISPQCTFELEDELTSVQNSLDDLKNAISACKAEITGICGKVIPGQGRIAMCLLANKSSASKDCADAIQKIEATASQ
jgi:Golgi apparatus protein 1